MSNDTDHFILTRFNLPSRGPESLVRARPDWLRNRVELFRRYTVPSMLAQDTSEFRWIIYFDPQSPRWLLEQIDADRAAGLYVPLFAESVDRQALLADLRLHTPKPARRLITTNLDNDDGLASNFVRRVQAADHGSGRHAIYLAEGLIKSGTALFFRADKHNAFCSVAEDWNDAVTCWWEWHTLLAEHMPATVVRGDPGWLQVIHTTNVSNRKRGTLTSPAPHRPHYPGLLDDVHTPNGMDMLSEHLLHVPLRNAREITRAGVKYVIVKSAGKEGLERVKLLLARRPRAKKQGP